jgi:hypothetical protein
MHRNEFNPGERSSDEDNHNRRDHRFYAQGSEVCKVAKARCLLPPLRRCGNPGEKADTPLRTCMVGVGPAFKPS